jgi:hypothetical protein
MLLGILVQRGNHLRRSHLSDQPGVEPACLLLYQSFEETFIA